MNDVLPFAVVIIAVSGAGLLAVWSNRFSTQLRIPAPVLFLVVAAVASDLVPALRHPGRSIWCSGSSRWRWC